MFTKKLYSYQAKAINGDDGLVYRINKAIARRVQDMSIGNGAEPHDILLSSPTGSGKTVMLEKTIIDIHNGGVRTTFSFPNGTSVELPRTISIILEPNSLDRQTFRRFVDDGIGVSEGLRVMNYDNLQNVSSLDAGDVIIVNWSSINKKGNKIRRENENGTGISQLVSDAKAKGIIFIVYIDEAHMYKNTDKSREFLDIIAPEVIVNMTATPTDELKTECGEDHIHVPHKDVVDTGVIVKRGYVNQNLDLYVSQLSKLFPGERFDPNFQEAYGAAMQAMSMDKMYLAEGSPVHTLFSCQVPVKGTAITDSQLSKDSDDDLDWANKLVRFFNRVFGWSVEGGEIAILLATRKENIEDIASNTSKVRVLIFKYAVAVGYDIPRMKTMAMLNNAKTKPFTLQIMGRLTRQPELRHYDNDELNAYYVYTSNNLVDNLIKSNPDEIAMGTVSHDPKDPETHNLIMDGFNGLLTAHRVPRKETRADSEFEDALHTAVSDVLIDRNVISPSQGGDNLLSSMRDIANDYDHDVRRFLQKLGFNSNATMTINAFKGTVEDVDLGTFQSDSTINLDVDDNGIRASVGNAIYKVCTENGYWKDHASKIREFLTILLRPFDDGAEIGFDILAAAENSTALYGLITDIITRTRKHAGNAINGTTYVKFVDDYTIPARYNAPESDTDIHDDNLTFGMITKLDSQAEMTWLKTVFPALRTRLASDGYTHISMSKQMTQSASWIGIPYKPFGETDEEIENSNIFYPDWTIECLDSNGNPALFIIETKNQTTRRSDLGGDDIDAETKADAMDKWVALNRRKGFSNLHACVVNLKDFKPQSPLIIGVMGDRNAGLTLDTWIDRESTIK